MVLHQDTEFNQTLHEMGFQQWFTDYIDEMEEELKTEFSRHKVLLENRKTVKMLEQEVNDLRKNINYGKVKIERKRIREEKTEKQSIRTADKVLSGISPASKQAVLNEELLSPGEEASLKLTETFNAVEQVRKHLDKELSDITKNEEKRKIREQVTEELLASFYKTIGDHTKEIEKMIDIEKPTNAQTSKE